MKILRTLVLVVAAMATGGVGFYSFKIFDARQTTSDLITNVLARTDVTMKDLSAEQVEILLAIEDPTFWTNDGLDFKTPGQGMTTLTQALGKRIFYKPFKPGITKVELILLSKFALAQIATKEDILNAFLTVAYLGEHEGMSVTGFGQGALVWYGKDFKDLDRREYIGLVAMLIAPVTLNTAGGAEKLHERQNRIEQLLAGECEPGGLRDVWYSDCGKHA